MDRSLRDSRLETTDRAGVYWSTSLSGQYLLPGTAERWSLRRLVLPLAPACFCGCYPCCGLLHYPLPHKTNSLLFPVKQQGRRGGGGSEKNEREGGGLGLQRNGDGCERFSGNPGRNAQIRKRAGGSQVLMERGGLAMTLKQEAVCSAAAEWWQLRTEREHLELPLPRLSSSHQHHHVLFCSFLWYHGQ